MKHTIFFLAAVLFAQLIFAQQSEISRDHNGSKTVKGFLSKQELATDTAFAWFPQNHKSFKPDQAGITAFQANKDSINIIAFGGTWCDDTKLILPQFFALADAANFPESRITILGVDRDKKTIQHLSEAFNVTNVPTFIVMKKGKEIGRVVEFGKTGLPVKELAEIIASSSKK